MRHSKLLFNLLFCICLTPFAFEVKKENLHNEIKLQGVLITSQQHDITCSTEIDQLEPMVVYGDHVEFNQPLYRIYSNTLTQQVIKAFQQYTASLHESLLKAQTIEMNEELLKIGGLSRTKWSQDKIEYIRSTQQKEEAEQALIKLLEYYQLTFDDIQEWSAFDATAIKLQLNDRKAYIYAPAAGTFVKSPNKDQPQPLGTLIPTHHYVFEAVVDEYMVSDLLIGQTAEIALNAQQKQYMGYVSHLLRQPTGQHNPTQYKVWITPNEIDDEVILGMHAQIKIPQQDSAMLLIPLSHVNHIDGKNFVTVKRNNQLSIETVTLGDTNQNMVQILTGLQEGDQIVQPN